GPLTIAPSHSHCAPRSALLLLPLLLSVARRDCRYSFLPTQPLAPPPPRIPVQPATAAFVPGARPDRVPPPLPPGSSASRPDRSPATRPIPSSPRPASADQFARSFALR